MSILRLATGIVIMIVFSITLFLGWIFRQEVRPSWHEIILPAAGAFDPDKKLRFSIGQLRFDIPNRNLMIPFSGSEKPFNWDVCEHDELARLEQYRGVCQTKKAAVFFTITIDSLSAKDRIQRIAGTLGWNQGYVFEPELEAYWQSHFPFEKQGRQPLLNTRLYEAFEESEEEFAFIAKDKSAFFQRIICAREISKPKILQSLYCSVRIPYMEGRFPRQAGGTYPYTIEFTLPASSIDQISSVADDVKANITSFLEHFPLTRTHILH